MIKKIFKKMDYVIISIVVLLFLVGVVALYSANGGIDGDTSECAKQIIWFMAGVVGAVFIIMIDYNVLGKLWLPLYMLILILLVAVLFTTPINGATSWFRIGSMSLQPSEFAKIVLILGTAKVIEVFKKRETLNKPLSILAILAFVLLPVALIIMQPDYGTAMVILVILVTMLFVAGIKWRYVICAMLAVAIIIPVAYVYVLPQHAKNRIDVFLNPQLDPRGAGYNIIQSKLAVGSGQLWGMGLFEGNQTQLGILPMKTTDFIYAVISEEMGFIISSVVIILFVILLARILDIAKTSKDLYGSLICTGVFGMMLAHFIENVGMTMGLMPITGIPLPFISYGGSAMLTNMIAIGIVLSVASRRQKNLFLE
ncbi:MAG: rod shape-determining protein RodA [Clostridia bacterium]|nr:rod shape-determining protein RodA [Clostridia bacterium]